MSNVDRLFEFDRRRDACCGLRTTGDSSGEFERGLFARSTLHWILLRVEISEEEWQRALNHAEGIQRHLDRSQPESLIAGPRAESQSPDQGPKSEPDVCSICRRPILNGHLALSRSGVSLRYAN